MEPASRAAPPLPDHLHSPTLHAGFWQRFAAYLIDCLILIPAFLILEFVLVVPLVAAGASRHQPGAAPAVGWIIFVWLLIIVLPWLYYALCESSRLQATPGKLALGLRVTDIYGRRIGFGKATGRYFGKLVSGLIMNIGYMMAGWTARKQALHDLMADCCVVRRDALIAFENGTLDTSGGVPGTGMPGWAVGLIVLGAFFVVVIPVVAILAAIAIPAYQDYVIRAQVMEGITLADGARTAVAEYVFNNNGSLPSNNAAAGLASAGSITGNYVAQVEVRNGDIVVTYGRRANEKIASEHLLLHPHGDRSSVQWSCGSDDIADKYLPSSCRRQSVD
ncbi:MAG TPA: RDD family protein [Rhodanobacteraceae bacterium]